jgi:hypothetical protein
MNSRHAALQFYRLLQARDPNARARWLEIIELARLGDPQAVRAVRLVQSVIPRGPRISGPGNVSPQRIEQLRRMLIKARYSVPAVERF